MERRRRSRWNVMERTRRNDLKRDDESLSGGWNGKWLARALRVRRRKLLTYVIADRCRHRLVAGDRAQGAGGRASVIDDDSKVGTCHPQPLRLHIPSTWSTPKVEQHLHRHDPPFLHQQTNALSEPPTKQPNRESVYGVCSEVVGWALWLTRRLRIRLCFATAVYHEQHRIYL
jgi:hypothetical protein